MNGEELLHYGTKGMKWKKKKQYSPDIDFHNSAAQRRAEQNAALAALTKPKSGKIKIQSPDISFHNDSAKRKLKQNTAKKKEKRKRVGTKVAKVKAMSIKVAMEHRVATRSRISEV